MKTRAWAMFWLIGLIWGSSFMFISVGVRELRPIEVVFIRTAIGALGLWLVIFLRRVPTITDWRNIRAVIIIGLGNVLAPFLLISWGEQYIPSGLAAVLQSTAALFALVIAHFAFADESMSIRKVIGLVTGFIGVVVLFSGDLSGGDDSSLALLGQLAIVGASLFYATFTTYSRKMIRGSIEPVVMAGGTMLVAALASAPLVFFTEGGFTPLRQPLSSDVLWSMVILGALNTFVAYLFYYFIVRELGVARTSMVTYIVPIVGLVLGALFLNEEVGTTLLIGTALIFAGIGVVNLQLRRRAKTEVASSSIEQAQAEA